MSRLTVNSSHIAMLLAIDCFGYQPPIKVPRERSMQSPEVQQAKLKATREKRRRKYLKHVQEGH